MRETFKIVNYSWLLFARFHDGFNSSPIDEHGRWCLQSWWSRAMLQHEEEISMATLRAAPTRHHHTEQFSGILTDPILTQPTPRGREGWEKPKHKLACKQQAIATTLCEELQASNCIYKSQGAPARGIKPPLL